MDVQRQHERQRIVAVEFEESRLDSGGLARSVAIAPVEDHAFVNRDRLEQAVRPDVGDERIESLALEQRQDVGVGVGFHLGSIAPVARGKNRPYASTQSSAIMRWASRTSSWPAQISSRMRHSRRSLASAFHFGSIYRRGSGQRLRIVVGAADSERDQMVDLKVRVRAGRQAVFGHDAVVALARPVAQFARAVEQISPDVGCPDGAGRQGRIGHDGRIREGGRRQHQQPPPPRPRGCPRKPVSASEGIPPTSKAPEGRPGPLRRPPAKPSTRRSSIMLAPLAGPELLAPWRASSRIREERGSLASVCHQAPPRRRTGARKGEEDEAGEGLRRAQHCAQYGRPGA